jgi:hypothetical protein
MWRHMPRRQNISLVHFFPPFAAAMRWKQAEKETLEKRRERVRRGGKVMTSANVDAVVTTCDGSDCGWDMRILLQKLGAVKLCVGAGRFDDERLLVEVEYLMCRIT